MKVAIVTDSLTNLTSVDLERYPDVYYGYLNVIVDGKAYAEQKEIDNDRLFRMIDEVPTIPHHNQHRRSLFSYTQT